MKRTVFFLIFVLVLGGLVSQVAANEFCASGGIGIWQISNPLTAPKMSFAVADTGSHVYILGGRIEGDIITNTVEFAEITGSTISPWKVTEPLAVARAFSAAAFINDTVYVIGGNDGIQPLSSIEMARADTSGFLDTWIFISPMPAPRVGAAALAVTRLYVVGGYGFSGVESATINPDGSLGEWRSESAMSEVRGGLALVRWGDFLYAIGGQDQCPLASVERAEIKTDGSLGPWQAEAPMTTARLEFAAAAVDGYVYAIGGRPNCAPAGAPSFDTVERAKINPDGSLQSWEIVSMMTTRRWGLGAVAVSPRIFALGGSSSDFNATPILLDSTEAWDTRAPVENGLTINDGALFTNQVVVTLTIGAKPLRGGLLMQVSNDGGFAGAEWEPYSSCKQWQITEYGSSVIARTVYVRYKDGGGTSNTYQDDIILDMSPPEGFMEVSMGAAFLGAKVAVQASSTYTYSLYLPLVSGGPSPNATLHLHAEDDASGVADMTISNRADFQGATWEPYKTAKAWYIPDDAATVYAKLRDGAGNESSVISASVP